MADGLRGPSFHLEPLERPCPRAEQKGVLPESHKSTGRSMPSLAPEALPVPSTACVPKGDTAQVRGAGATHSLVPVGQDRTPPAETPSLIPQTLSWEQAALGEPRRPST